MRVRKDSLSQEVRARKENQKREPKKEEQTKKNRRKKNRRKKNHPPVSRGKMRVAGGKILRLRSE